MDEIIIRECIKRLGKVDPDKPWMTSRGLSKRIFESTGHQYAVGEIETALIAYTQRPDRKIRYSYYPSKKTLDVLWGNVDVVGHGGNPAELHRIDEPDSELSEETKRERPWFFVSHNAFDFAAVLEMRKILSSANLGAWLFETDIPHGGQITTSVKEAIESCDFFVSYVTRRSIGSLWVQKEFEVARRSGACETVVVLDGQDEALLDVFAAWTGEWPPEREKTGRFCTIAAKQLGRSSNSRWCDRCQEFMDSLHELLGDKNRVLLHPAPASLSGMSTGKLRLEAFDQFVSAVRFDSSTA